MELSLKEIAFLEISHIPHILASADALKKGYVAYFVVLTITILLSIANHVPYLDNPKLDYLEKASTLITITYTLVEFHNYINYVDIALGIFCVILYYIAFFDYARQDSRYVSLHTLWHVLSGILLYSIILKANKKQPG